VVVSIVVALLSRGCVGQQRGGALQHGAGST
jgi:hypothetical protein